MIDGMNKKEIINMWVKHVIDCDWNVIDMED